MTSKFNLTVFALFLVLNSIAIVSPAQSGESVAVFLKGGDVRIGKVVNTDNMGNIRLTNDCGIFNIKEADIDSITSVKTSVGTSVNSNTSSPGNKQVNETITDKPEEKNDRKWYNLTSVALLMGQGQNGFLPVPSITTVTGIRLGSNVMAGIGVGYEYYDWSVMPVFADVKYTLDIDRIMPFFSMKLGYGFPLGKASQVDNDFYNGEITNLNGGLQLNPEAGLMIRTSGSTSALVLSIGYHFQQVSYEYNKYSWWGYQYDNTVVHTDYNRISFRIGYLF
jgi:hypothetical protein